MIGGRSNQMVLLPCISSGSARIAWTRNYRQASHQRARAPPGNHASGSSMSVHWTGS